MSYRLHAHNPLASDVRRIAADQLGKAIRQLECESNAHEAIFTARKRIKKVRGLYRLVQAGQPTFFKRENRRLRDVGRSLGAMRDASARIDTLERLWQYAAAEQTLATVDGQHAGLSIAEMQQLFSVHARLLEQRERIAGELEHENDSVVRAVVACRQARDALQALSFSNKPRRCAAIVGEGYARTWQRARTLLEDAGRTGCASRFHAARKWVKYHRMHCTLLQACWPSMFALRADVARRLSLCLGEDHDVSVLLAHLGDSEHPGVSTHPTLNALATAISRQRRDEALALAAPLLRDPPLATERYVAALFRLSRSTAPRS